MTDLSRSIAVKPIIKYPREVQVGKTYLMTMDLQPEEGFEWQYEEEEYPIYCSVDSNLFESKPVGEPIIVLHRFGGSYGEARFLITASSESRQGGIKVVFINAWGVSIKVIELEQIRLVSRSLIHSESNLTTEREVSIKNIEVATSDGITNEVFEAEEQKTKQIKVATARALILTALPVEYLAVRAHLMDLRDEIHPQGTIYERGRFQGNGQEWEVGIAEVGAGNSGAAVEAERAIAHFKPDILFSVGIAGGIKDIAVGDVIAVTKVYSYEAGKVGEQFFTRPALGQSAYALVQRARAEARKGEWLKRLSSIPASQPQPRVFVAPIAAGEKVVASKESDVFNFIRASYNDATALEVEGFGFLSAAFAYPNIQTVVIRGISDLIQKNADDPVEGTDEERQERASRNASAFAFEVLANSENSLQVYKPAPNFFPYDDAWVGRDAQIQSLSDRIRGNCRLLILVGIPGIGKTALGERLVVEVSDWFENDWSHYHQENFDNEQQTSDFASVAARWLEKWGELITPDARKDSQQLLHQLIKYLCENRYLIQMDSLENILQGNEKEGWNTFKDEWWLSFFNSYMRAESCESRFILTSQDLPGQIEEVGNQYQNFWYCQPLSGLEKSEQIALFEKTELDVSPDSTSRTYLERIANAYEGHPLALRVIAGEIKNKPFEGDVLAYWGRYGNELEEIEKAIAEAQEGKSVGADDKFKLDRFTKMLKRNVRSRFNRVFAKLLEDAKWAYILLCETSIYRCAVPEIFWLSHLEDWERNEEEQIAALNALRDRYLIEELVVNNQLLLRQNNLIRSIALEHLNNLDADDIIDILNISSTEKRRSLPIGLGLEEIIPSSLRERTHYFAIINWLTKYQPNQNSTNIDQVRGYLEAFYHLCELQSWESANQLLSLQIDTSTNQELLDQLGIWGYYSEQISLCEKLLGRLNQVSDFRLRSCLGNAAYIHGDYNLAIKYFQQSLQDADQIHEQDAKGSAFNNLGTVYNVLGNYSEAIRYYQQALTISSESQNFSTTGKALSNLGIIYSNLGNYPQAIDYYQQALSITRQVGDRLEEGYTLGNLGLVYNFLGNHEQAVAYCQQALVISQEIGDRYSEENVLGNLGIAYASLADYSRAIEYHQHQLTIAREIGDRRGEAIALSRLGSCLIKFNQYSESLSYLEAALQIFNVIGDRANQANSLKALAELYQGLGQLDTARQCVEQALSIAAELGIPLVQEIQNLEALIREA